MKQAIAHIALVVDDYDEAIKFYTERLHFTLLEDTVLSPSKRWVLVAPSELAPEGFVNVLTGKTHPIVW